MAPHESSDAKTKFTPYDCVPGHKDWSGFKLNLLSHGGKANEYGDSIAMRLLSDRRQRLQRHLRLHAACCLLPPLGYDSQ